MRALLRKTVIGAAVLISLSLLEVFISFTLSEVDLSPDDSVKLLGHIKLDKGEPLASSASDSRHHSWVDHGQSRLHRSAKSVLSPINASDGVRQKVLSEKSKNSSLVKVGKSLSPTLADRQYGSHGQPSELADVFIGVKTSGKYHASRVQLVLQTWYLLAKDQVFFFTDENDRALSESTGGHLINTNCTASHERKALSCKTSVEFDAFLASKKRWLCHFDDDVYVNIPELLKLLKKYKHTEDWYLGKPSLRYPLERRDFDHPGGKAVFWFATGSGYCISRGLALKMMPHAGGVVPINATRIGKATCGKKLSQIGGRFMAVSEKIRLPDDCVMGYIIEHLLKKKLTVIDEFRSHLEALTILKPDKLKTQITLSYSNYGQRLNRVNVVGFSLEDDPTRFKSIHCLLFPALEECHKMKT